MCDQHIASTAWSSTPSTRPQNEDAESNRQRREVDPPGDDVPPGARLCGNQNFTARLATAPAASFSQTLAVAARGVGKRTELADRDAFVSEVRDLKASLEHGNVKEDFVEEAVQVFRFEPSRLELLANGESTDGIWDRFEWTRDADGAWSEPRRLMPY